MISDFKLMELTNLIILNGISEFIVNLREVYLDIHVILSR